MYIFFIVYLGIAKTDTYYEQAEKLLENFYEADLAEIDSLLEQSFRPSFKAYDTLFELYLFGDLEKKISRNYTLASKYLNKALSLHSSKAFFSAAVLFQEILLTTEFEEIESIITLPMTTIKSLKTKHSGHDLLEISFYSAVKECFLSKSQTPPSFIQKSILDESKQFNLYPVFDYDDCSFDRSLTFAAISQAFYARDYIEELGKPQDKIKQEDLEKDIAYGEENEKVISLYSKYFDNNQNSAGMANLGQNYLHGNNIFGISPDYNEALNYFSKSLDLGNDKVAADLGKMYLKGLGVEKNVTKALEFFEIAAEQGSVDAMRQLSVIYQKGKIVEKNDTKAFKYAETAAELGDIQSINNVGVYYLYGIGVEIDTEIGIEYIELAADYGSPAAKYNLACAYYNGDFVDVDYWKAFDLSMQVVYAAQQDNYMNLGYQRFKRGDYKGAYLYFLFASNLGYLEASKSIVFMFSRGLTGNKCKLGEEYCKGVYLYKGVLRNDSFSFTNMAKLLYVGGDNLEANYTEAFRYFSAAPGTGETLFNIAYMTEHGLGVVKDYDKAKEMYNSIIIKSDSKQIDSYAKYPAYFSLFFLHLKNLLDIS